MVIIVYIFRRLNTQKFTKINKQQQQQNPYVSELENLFWEMQLLVCIAMQNIAMHLMLVRISMK